MSSEVLAEIGATLRDAKAGRWASYPVGPPYVQYVETLLRHIRAQDERVKALEDVAEAAKLFMPHVFYEGRWPFSARYVSGPGYDLQEALRRLREQYKSELEACCEREQVRWEAEKELRAEVEALRANNEWCHNMVAGLRKTNEKQAADLAAAREALEELVRAADEFSADQSGATGSRCGLTQPVTVEEAEALNRSIERVRDILSLLDIGE